MSPTPPTYDALVARVRALEEAVKSAAICLHYWYGGAPQGTAREETRVILNKLYDAIDAPVSWRPQ